MRVTRHGWRFWTMCGGLSAPRPLPPPRLCLDERPVTEERPRAIDLNAEAQKLDSLKAKRRDLASAAEPLIAQCKAEFPE